MPNDISLSSLTIESITAQARESFEDISGVLMAMDNNWKQLENFGKLLIAAKSKVPHGKWEDWIVDTFSGRLALRTAQRWMADSKAPKMALLKNPDTPRSQRKKGQVVVTKPDPPKPSATESSTTEQDDDPAPKPPTIRTTAKGTETVKEDDKPKTQPITPEILPDEPEKPAVDVVEAFDRTGRIIDAFVIQCDIERFLDLKEKAGLLGEGKKAAKQLRKLADKLDPPKKFTKPDGNDVSEYMLTLPDAKGRDVAKAADGFMDHYESNGWMVGKVKMQDWRATARKWLKNQDLFSGGSGNGRRAETTGSGNSRPPVERAKINYK